MRQCFLQWTRMTIVKKRTIACSFNAEIHVEHFRTTLKDTYEIDVKKWTMCYIADNKSTNHKLTHLVGLLHIGCLKHLLNLDIKQWVK